MNPQKRMAYSQNKGFQERCKWYMYNHARTILEAETPDADDLKLAQAVWSKQADFQNVALIILTNPTIGTCVDNDNPVSDSDIEYVVSTENKFNTIAKTLISAGVI